MGEFGEMERQARMEWFCWHFNLGWSCFLGGGKEMWRVGCGADHSLACPSPFKSCVKSMSKPWEAILPESSSYCPCLAHQHLQVDKGIAQPFNCSETTHGEDLLQAPVLTRRSRGTLKKPWCLACCLSVSPFGTHSISSEMLSPVFSHSLIHFANQTFVSAIYAWLLISILS